jgi:hypothetical protein
MIATEFPDKTLYPLFYTANRKEFIIEPGEMLYIPVGWYHLIISDTTDETTMLNAAINYFYETEWTFTNTDYRYPMKLNHNIHKSFDYMKHLKKHENIKCIECPHNRFTHWTNRCLITESDECKDYVLSWDEFYKKKDENKCFYAAAHNDDELMSFDPKSKNFGKTMFCSWWINFGNVTSRMHYDTADNLLCQVAGRKRVILFPHSEWPKLYLINPYPPEFLHQVQKLLKLHI